MNRILDALYIGNLHPGEHKAEYNPEERRLEDELERLAADWEDSHSTQETEALENMLSLTGRIHFFSERRAFACGFRLGALIMTDVFTSPESGMIE